MNSWNKVLFDSVLISPQLQYSGVQKSETTSETAAIFVSIFQHTYFITHSMIRSK